jgi:hypothetical protein
VTAVLHQTATNSDYVAKAAAYSAHETKKTVLAYLHHQTNKTAQRTAAAFLLTHATGA